MPEITLKPVKRTPILEEYFQRFNHNPSPESAKFQTMEEREELAEMALSRNKPVDEWANRHLYKMGTVLDKLYQKS